MRKTNRKFQFITGAVILSAYLMTSPTHIVCAGDINANEQAIIYEVSQTFEYEGKTYRAYEDYIELAKQYLSMDEYDLTKEQCDQVIAKVYASVAEGIANGYLYEVTEEDVVIEHTEDDLTELTEKLTETIESTVQVTEEQPSVENTQKVESNIQDAEIALEDQTGSTKEENKNPNDISNSNLEQEHKETVIKKTGFSLRGTILTGGVMMSVLILNLGVAFNISRKRNEQWTD